MSPHSFHIPVMGIGFTIDTPIKVAHLGINSTISLVDDILIEKIRKMYCLQNNIAYLEIKTDDEDHRAKRITSYLNLVHDLISKKFDKLLNCSETSFSDIKKYFSLLPESSILKKEFIQQVQNNFSFEHISKWLKNNLQLGSIDVNIMTKVDKTNYIGNEPLPNMYNDAHAALRGYANSKLSSSLVLSAGMNPKLYSYLEQFEDFYPDKNGLLKKKIVLKVSDYRSAVIQGKFLAKKGLWVSEYRIESGLNCGGHAFATEGNLMGPILAQFRDQKEELINNSRDLFYNALKDKGMKVPVHVPSTRITAQGGVGTSEEHNFILDHYKADSVGWGTPFLLVPDATTLDKNTRKKLIDAKEKDIYLSGISPLGVPFQNLRSNTKDLEKIQAIQRGRPGSKCPKRFVALNKEFNEYGICTASREYQRLKIKELKSLSLDKLEYDHRYSKIVEKTCTCVGLGTAALLAYDLDTHVEGEGVAICPGPNMAYFSKTMKMEDITDHIYGNANFVDNPNRPIMYIKELQMYMAVLKEKIDESKNKFNRKHEKYLNSFSSNLKNGIQYYQNLFTNVVDQFSELKTNIMAELQDSQTQLEKLMSEILQNSEMFKKKIVN